MHDRLLKKNMIFKWINVIVIVSPRGNRYVLREIYFILIDAFAIGINEVASIERDTGTFTSR